MASIRPTVSWSRIPIARIEDLSDAVFGAGLEATQMSGGVLSGGMAFAQDDGILYSSGRIDGRAALFGPLSSEAVTLGVGLRLPTGTRHWMAEVETGDVGVFLPGDTHDAIYTAGSLYACITLSPETLERQAAMEDLVLDRRTLGGTGVCNRRLAPDLLSHLTSGFQRLHEATDRGYGDALEVLLLHSLVSHLARRPYPVIGGRHPGAYGKIVQRARAYIVDHLSEAMTADAIAAAAFTSRRTLFRAFAHVLDETPLSYVRRLRLHRIRLGLAGDAEHVRTVSLIANEWGISDPGRMSGWYRELFGELPGQTLARAARSIH